MATHSSVLSWRIYMVCLALELVGLLVVLGFSVGMEAFDEFLLINPMHESEK